MKIEENERILFQGDSVTDVGRDREDGSSLGAGYPMMTAAWFAAKHSEKNVDFLNRGNGGERIRDLEGRWQEDCLDLKPTIVSILIGINDCWRRFDNNEPTTAGEFEVSYRNLLDRIKEQGINKVILLEPFVLPVTEDRKAWREDLDPKIHVIRELAREYGAILIPLDGIFNAASVLKPSTFWTIDGVHPTNAGHALIAQEWLKTVKAL